MAKFCILWKIEEYFNSLIKILVYYNILEDGTEIFSISKILLDIYKSFKEKKNEAFNFKNFPFFALQKDPFY